MNNIEDKPVQATVNKKIIVAREFIKSVVVWKKVFETIERLKKLGIEFEISKSGKVIKKK